MGSGRCDAEAPRGVTNRRAAHRLMAGHARHRRDDQANDGIRSISPPPIGGPGNPPLRRRADPIGLPDIPHGLTLGGDFYWHRPGVLSKIEQVLEMMDKFDHV